MKRLKHDLSSAFPFALRSPTWLALLEALGNYVATISHPIKTSLDLKAGSGEVGWMDGSRWDLLASAKKWAGDLKLHNLKVKKELLVLGLMVAMWLQWYPQIKIYKISIDVQTYLITEV